MKFYTVFVMALIVPRIVFADYIFTERTQYNAVDEANPYQVLSRATHQISEHCDGSHTIGCALSHISYRYDVEQLSKKRCRVKNFDIIHNITYHIPRWIHADKSAYTGEWRAIEQEVLEHERQHGLIYRNTMRSAYNALRSFTTNCRDIKNAIALKMKRTQDRAEQQHQAFHARDGAHLTTSFP